MKTRPGRRAHSPADRRRWPALAATTPTPKTADADPRVLRLGRLDQAVAKQAKQGEGVAQASARRRSTRPRSRRSCSTSTRPASNNYPCLDAKGGIPYDGGDLRRLRGRLRRARRSSRCSRCSSGPRRLRVKVFFITGRPEAIRDGTLNNLKARRLQGQVRADPAAQRVRPTTRWSPTRAGARKKIQKRGFKIIANVGDQQSDLKGGFSERTYKLPNPIYSDSIERPPRSLWDRLLAEPERAPEHIALAASERFGPQAEEWVRVAGAGHTPEKLARDRLPQARAHGAARGRRARHRRHLHGGARRGRADLDPEPDGLLHRGRLRLRPACTRCARPSCSPSRASTRRPPRRARRSTAWAS